MFQLIFKGECTPGTDPEAARNSARTLFKASADQVTRLFSGQPVVIRNRLEEGQAEKYRSVLQKHGMVAYVEPMETTVAPKKEPAPQQGPSEPEEPSAPDSGGPVKVEPGDRPNVAGDKVDSILAGSSLTLDPVGITIAEHKEVKAPMFEHLDEWTLAPPGVRLVESRNSPPPVMPDVSHLSLVEPDDPGQQ
jgi:hypothetical protein